MEEKGGSKARRGGVGAYSGILATRSCEDLFSGLKLATEYIIGRVSMGQTVSRRRTKYLAVRRKN